MKVLFKSLSIGVILIAVLLSTVIKINPATVSADQWQLKPDASEVPATKTWTISFKSPIDPSTVTNRHIYVLNKEDKKVDVKLELQENKTKVTVQAPVTGYMLEQTYTLYIKESIKYANGENLEKNIKFPFTISSELPTIASQKTLKQIFTEAKKSETYGIPAVAEESTTAEPSSKSSSHSSVKTKADYSTTNNQEANVDEADRVKTDGTYIYSIQNHHVTITKALPADQMKNVAKLSYDQNFSPYQMFLSNEKLIVIGRSYQDITMEKSKKASFIMPRNNHVKAIIYNIEDPSQPKKLREIELEGHLVTARMIDSVVYLVANYMPPYWIEEAPLRPSFKDSLVSEKMTPIAYNSIHYIPGSQEANYSMITSFDTSKLDEKAKTTTYLGSSSKIYMSKNNLYLTSTKYPYVGLPKDTAISNTDIAETHMYKFTLNGTQVNYKAHGTVPGRILNQFSMDEHESYFRVATTQGFSWRTDEESTNNLYVLNDKLEVVGKLENLAPGEQIYSVRYMQDRAYIVTFKTVDPLFVIDLKDPEKPKVLGKLKIPGFSNYLHPYDENHVIGFGKNTKELPPLGHSNEPRIVTNGVKISIFDVSDVTHPKEKFTEIIEGYGTQSVLNHDHKALLFSKEKGIFAFPITIYENSAQNIGENGEWFYKNAFSFQGALVYNIDLQEGFNLKAKISHLSSNQPKWQSEISRLLYINNNVYTISPLKLMAHDMKNYELLSEVKLPSFKQK